MQRAALQKAAAVGHGDAGTEEMMHEADEQLWPIAETSEHGQRISIPDSVLTAASLCIT